MFKRLNPWDFIEDTASSEFINVADNDINFAEFDRVMAGGAVDDDTYGGWAASVGKSTRYTNEGNVSIGFGVFGIGRSMEFVFSHELGHTLGVFHANS